MKNIKRIIRSQFMVWIILVMGAFLLSAQKGNIANAMDLNDYWNQYSIDDETTPTAPRAVFAIDIDGDGDFDVVSANSDWNIDNKIVWYENLGGFPPTWAEHLIANLPIPTVLTDVFAIDLDGDKDADVISAATGGTALAWFENLGGSPPTWTTHVIPNNAASAISNTVPYTKGQNVGPSIFAIDLNNDHRIDILWGDGSRLGWLENLGGSPPSWSEKHNIPNTLWESAPGTSVFAIDIYNDGDIDVVAGTCGSNSKLAWYENLGGTSPNWVEHVMDSSLTGGFMDVFAIDLDKDGDMDVLAGSYWYENNGNHPPIWFEHYIGSPGTDIFATDLDNDCDIDVIGINASTNRIYWSENLGGSPPSWSWHPIGDGSWIFPVDMNRNGNMDIVAGLEEYYYGIYYGEILWYENPFTSSHANTITITKISDVGNDQGKQVRIDWSSFFCNDTLVTHFTIFRKIDTLLVSSLGVNSEIFSSGDYPPGQWEMLGTYPAYGETLYSATVPTLKDSTITEGMYWSLFFVRAGTNNPINYFDSPVDSGYSVDNLAPSTPIGLFASHQPTRTKLTWVRSSDSDFDYYTIYRDTVSGFMPNSSNRLGFTIDTTFFDTTPPWGITYYYRVSATDFSGNESNPSDPAEIIHYITGDANSGGVIEIGDIVYLITYLYKNGPAPIPLQAGDASCNGVVDVGDVIYLINYLFKGGSAPGCK